MVIIGNLYFLPKGAYIKIMSTYRRYEKYKVISFAKTNGRFGDLSNMAKDYVLFVNELSIPSVESLYQACKFSLYPKIQEEILLESNPMRSKITSRKYQSFIRQDWDNIKFNVMEWCLKIKLMQYWDKFGKTLKETEGKDIVEYSAKDTIWGAKPEGDYLVGVNAMGRLLMKIRQEYVIANKQPEYVLPPNITGFLLLGNPITKVYAPEYYLDDLDM